MTWTARLLRGADDIGTEQAGPTTSSGTIMVDTCGESAQTSYSVLAKLGESDTSLGIRLREGLPLQTYASLAGWSNADPTLEMGPMLVRSVNCSEHPDKPGLFAVNYETSGFGSPTQQIGGATVLMGTPDIQISTSARPRMTAAFRSKPTVPVETSANLVTSSSPHVFDTDAVWHTGVDIGGKKVDVNTAPIQVPIDQTVITITYPIRYPFRQWDGTWDSCRSVPNGIIGGRNAEAFIGYPIGSLLFESIDVQPLHHEFRTVTLVFVYDQYKHAIQIPKTLAQFSSPTTIDATTGATQTLSVLWQQPFADAYYVNTTANNYSIQATINDAGLFDYLQQFDGTGDNC